jgi:undecaprenyl-diphosphatase
MSTRFDHPDSAGAMRASSASTLSGRDGADLRPAPILSQRTAILVIMGAMMLAALLALAVVRGWAEPLDRWGFDVIRTAGPYGAADAPLWVRETVRDVTAIGGAFPLTVAVIATGTYLIVSGRARLAWLLGFSATVATLANVWLKASFARLRPELEGQLVHVYNASFPSGHALLSATIILMLGGLLSVAARRRRQKLVILGTALALCIAIGLSRVWLGVHWPTDVLAGWLIGAAWAGATLLAAQRVERARQGVSLMGL